MRAVFVGAEKRLGRTPMAANDSCRQFGLTGMGCRLGYLLGCIAVVLTSLAFTLLPANAQSTQPRSFWELIDRDIQAIDDFVAFANRTDVTDTAVFDRAGALVVQLGNSIPTYDNALAPAEGQAIFDAIMSFRTAAVDYRRAYSAADAADIQLAFGAMNSALDRLDASVDKAVRVNQQRADEAQQTEDNIRALLVAGLVLSLAISTFLFIFAHRQQPDPIGHARAYAYMAMFKSSLIMVARFVVTLATNIAATGGGTYVVAWGAMAFGAFALASRAFTYLTKIKPSLDFAAQSKMPW
jgi:hypothetical protein